VLRPAGASAGPGTVFAWKELPRQRFSIGRTAVAGLHDRRDWLSARLFNFPLKVCEMLMYYSRRVSGLCDDVRAWRVSCARTPTA